MCEVAGDDEFKDRSRELTARWKDGAGANCRDGGLSPNASESGNDADIICSRLLLGSRLDVVQNMIERYVKDRTAEDIFYIDLRRSKQGTLTTFQERKLSTTISDKSKKSRSFTYGRDVPSR